MSDENKPMPIDEDFAIAMMVGCKYYFDNLTELTPNDDILAYDPAKKDDLLVFTEKLLGMAILALHGLNEPDILDGLKDLPPEEVN